MTNLTAPRALTDDNVKLLEVPIRRPSYLVLLIDFVEVHMGMATRDDGLRKANDESAEGIIDAHGHGTEHARGVTSPGTSAATPPSSVLMPGVASSPSSGSADYGTAYWHFLDRVGRFWTQHGDRENLGATGADAGQKAAGSLPRDTSAQPFGYDDGLWNANAQGLQVRFCTVAHARFGSVPLGPPLKPPKASLKLTVTAPCTLAGSPRRALRPPRHRALF